VTKLSNGPEWTALDIREHAPTHWVRSLDSS